MSEGSGDGGAREARGRSRERQECGGDGMKDCVGMSTRARQR